MQDIRWVPPKGFFEDDPPEEGDIPLAPVRTDVVYIDAKRVAKLLGVSESTFRKWKDGGLPEVEGEPLDKLPDPVLVDGICHWDKSAIVDWKEKHQKKRRIPRYGSFPGTKGKYLFEQY